MMRDYQVYEPTPEDVKRRRSDPFYWYHHILGRVNLIDMGIGELQMATDSRGKRRNRKRNRGRLRIVLHQEAPQTPREITDLLGKYGIRTRKYLHDGDNFYFHVRASQADWAITVLDRWKAGQLGKSWAEQTTQRKQARKAEAGSGFWGRLGL